MDKIETKKMLCLANSYKPPAGRCIAGREIVDNKLGPWIRPVSARETREISLAECRCDTGQGPDVLDVIEVSVLRHEPRRHQVENYVIAPGRWKKVAFVRAENLARHLDAPETIWPNTESSSAGYYDRVDPSDLAGVEGSLMLIRPESFSVQVTFNSRKNNKAFRGGFRYKGVYYNFSITDPKIREVFHGKDEGEYPLENVLLCVSLAEPWDVDHKCYKLVAAVIDATPSA